MKEIRSRYIWATRTRYTRDDAYWVVWLSIAGRKPLAHLPAWRRRLFHLPSIRWRLWPKPFSRYMYRSPTTASQEAPQTQTGHSS